MTRDQVFISYSHADSEWLIRLQTMLVPLARAGLKIWADTDIKPGEEWKKIIAEALTRTKVAVLLISPDFLASNFIHENELPPLLEAAKNEGLTIFWVPIRPSLYKHTIISDYQAAHPPSLPLSTLDPARQEDALAKIAELIGKLLPSVTPALPAEKGAGITAQTTTAERSKQIEAMGRVGEQLAETHNKWLQIMQPDSTTSALGAKATGTYCDELSEIDLKGCPTDFRDIFEGRIKTLRRFMWLLSQIPRSQVWLYLENVFSPIAAPRKYDQLGTEIQAAQLEIISSLDELKRLFLRYRDGG